MAGAAESAPQPAPVDGFSRVDPPTPRASRACETCARAKVKCTWPPGAEPGEESCSRCVRYRKECFIPEIKRRKKTGVSRFVQLEEKIDGVMTLLNANRQPQRRLTPVERSPDSTSRTPLMTRTAHSEPTLGYQSPQARLGPPSSSSQYREQPVSQLALPIDHVDIIPGFQIAFDEADRLLHLYRTQFCPSFPFVPIPCSLAAYDLFTDRPFLFRTIMQTVVPHSSAVQQQIKRWFSEYIATHIIVQQEKNLELLQAILVHVGWGELHFFVESSATNLLQVAAALVIELGLAKPARLHRFASYSLIDEAALKRGLKIKPRTHEDMRAMLGYLYLSSAAGGLSRRMQQAPSTSYLNQCCQTLYDTQEFESDRILVTLTRTQQLVTRVSLAFPSPEFNSDGSTWVDFHMPLHMTMNTLRNELEALKANETADVRQNPLFLLNYLGALIRLYEPVIAMRSSRSSNHCTDGTHRTTALWQCLDNIAKLLDTYLSIPVDNLSLLIFSAKTQLSFAILTASRLLFLEDSDWDVHLARQTLDFAAITQSLADHFQAADSFSAAHESSSKRKFTTDGSHNPRRHEDTRSRMVLYREKALWARSWYLAKVAPHKAVAEVCGAGSVENSAELDAGSVMPPEILDESIWQMLMDDDGFIVEHGVLSGLRLFA